MGGPVTCCVASAGPRCQSWPEGRCVRTAIRPPWVEPASKSSVSVGSLDLDPSTSDAAVCNYPGAGPTFVHHVRLPTQPFALGGVGDLPVALGTRGVEADLALAVATPGRPSSTRHSSLRKRRIDAVSWTLGGKQNGCCPAGRIATSAAMSTNHRRQMN